jgi:hypothetical protein
MNTSLKAEVFNNLRVQCKRCIAARRVRRPAQAV